MIDVNCSSKTLFDKKISLKLRILCLPCKHAAINFKLKIEIIQIKNRVLFESQEIIIDKIKASRSLSRN